ncbi:MAG: ribosome-associated translation inhibitor RaiA [Chloroflexia bacterium]
MTLDLSIRPKNFKLSDTQETQVRKRVERLPRHLDNLEQAEVLLSKEPTHFNSQRHQYVAQITLRTRNHNLIRSEVAHADLLSAVDDAISHLSRQIERFKGRFYHKKKGKTGVGKSSADLVTMHSVPEHSAPPTAATEPLSLDTANFNTGPLSEEEIGDIVRVKRFQIKPMYPDEAIEQMELLGHSFYVFYNAGDNLLNVLYRRTDGNYGLLQPELS